MKRRVFLQSIPALAVSTTVSMAASEPDEIMTVRGRIGAAHMGVTLTHEHLLANFKPHTEGGGDPVDYDRDEVARIVLPYLARIRELGCRTFVDATAVGLGRDVRLLQFRAEWTQYPHHHRQLRGRATAVRVRQLARVLARRWIDEWTHGIDSTECAGDSSSLGSTAAR